MTKKTTKPEKTVCLRRIPEKVFTEVEQYYIDHKVKDGITLEKIAKSLETTKTEIKKYLDVKNTKERVTEKTLAEAVQPIKQENVEPVPSPKQPTFPEDETRKKMRAKGVAIMTDVQSQQGDITKNANKGQMRYADCITKIRKYD